MKRAFFYFRDGKCIAGDTENPEELLEIINTARAKKMFTSLGKPDSVVAIFNPEHLVLVEFKEVTKDHGK